jgi:hypothetical protein
MGHDVSDKIQIAPASEKTFNGNIGRSNPFKPRRSIHEFATRNEGMARVTSAPPSRNLRSPRGEALMATA